MRSDFSLNDFSLIVVPRYARVVQVRRNDF